MATVDEMHAQNIARFALLEKRVAILEVEFQAGIAVFKFIGGAGVAILTAILIKLLVG